MLADLKLAKQALQEAVVLCILRPDSSKQIAVSKWVQTVTFLACLQI
jgi:hypothetical protein